MVRRTWSTRHRCLYWRRPARHGPLEELATGVFNRWEYSEFMPVVPWIDAGVIPLLQWRVLPPIEPLTLRRLALGDTAGMR